MKSRTILGSAGITLLIAGGAALAQNVWPSPTAGQNIPGSALTCWDGTNAIPCGSLKAGSPPVEMSAVNNTPHYSAAISAFGNSSTGDLFCIQGGIGKVLRVKSLHISGVASNATMNEITLTRRSTADSGGTPSSVTIVPNDTTNSASVATVTAYATAPTPGTAVGTVRSQRVPVGSVTTLVGGGVGLFQTAVPSGQPMVLRGASETLCVGVTNTAGGQWDVDAEWSEE